jgi:hypothetical protein
MLIHSACSHDFHIKPFSSYSLYIMYEFSKSTSDWLVKKIQNIEQNFIIWNIYIRNCITSPHSCHPHLGTCCTVTLVFVVPRQRTVPPSYAVNCYSIHELFVGVEALGSQPDLHLCGEMVVSWRQIWTIRRVDENLPVEELDWSICVSRCMGPHVVVH